LELGIGIWDLGKISLAIMAIMAIFIGIGIWDLGKNSLEIMEIFQSA
jgi:hypothetical protein